MSVSSSSSPSDSECDFYSVRSRESPSNSVAYGFQNVSSQHPSDDEEIIAIDGVPIDTDILDYNEFDGAKLFLDDTNPFNNERIEILLPPTPEQSSAITTLFRTSLPSLNQTPLATDIEKVILSRDSSALLDAMALALALSPNKGKEIRVKLSDISYFHSLFCCKKYLPFLASVLSVLENGQTKSNDTLKKEIQSIDSLLSPKLEGLISTLINDKATLPHQNTPSSQRVTEAVEALFSKALATHHWSSKIPSQLPSSLITQLRDSVPKPSATIISITGSQETSSPSTALLVSQVDGTYRVWFPIENTPFFPLPQKIFILEDLRGVLIKQFGPNYQITGYRMCYHQPYSPNHFDLITNAPSTVLGLINQYRAPRPPFNQSILPNLVRGFPPYKFKPAIIESITTSLLARIVDPILNEIIYLFPPTSRFTCENDATTPLLQELLSLVPHVEDPSPSRHITPSSKEPSPNEAWEKISLFITNYVFKIDDILKLEKIQELLDFKTKLIEKRSNGINLIAQKKEEITKILKTNERIIAKEFAKQSSNKDFNCTEEILAILPSLYGLSSQDLVNEHQQWVETNLQKAKPFSDHIQKLRNRSGCPSVPFELIVSQLCQNTTRLPTLSGVRTIGVGKHTLLWEQFTPTLRMLDIHLFSPQVDQSPLISILNKHLNREATFGSSIELIRFFQANKGDRLLAQCLETLDQDLEKESIPPGDFGIPAATSRARAIHIEALSTLLYLISLSGHGKTGSEETKVFSTNIQELERSARGTSTQFISHWLIWAETEAAKDITRWTSSLDDVVRSKQFLCPILAVFMPSGGSPAEGDSLQSQIEYSISKGGATLIAYRHPYDDLADCEHVKEIKHLVILSEILIGHDPMIVLFDLERNLMISLGEVQTSTVIKYIQASHPHASSITVTHYPWEGNANEPPATSLEQAIIASTLHDLVY